MEIKNNKGFKKFKNLKEGDIFRATFGGIFMKIPEVSLNGDWDNLFNTISLQTGALSIFPYHEDVQVLKVSLVIE